MNTDTGKIKAFQDLSEKEKKSGKWMEIPKAAITKVTGMNRKQRRTWAKQQKLK